MNHQKQPHDTASHVQKRTLLSLEVLQLWLDGYSLSQIAYLTCMSPSTVEELLREGWQDCEEDRAMRDADPLLFVVAAHRATLARLHRLLDRLELEFELSEMSEPTVEDGTGRRHTTEHAALLVQLSRQAASLLRAITQIQTRLATLQGLDGQAKGIGQASDVASFEELAHQRFTFVIDGPTVTEPDPEVVAEFERDDRDDPDASRA